MSTSIKALPLWFRYVVAILAGAAIVLALVLWVTHDPQPLVENAAPANHSQEATEVSEDRQVVIQEQAPQHRALGAAATPTHAAVATITAYMSSQIADGLIPGPLDGATTCRPVAGTGTRSAFRCEVRAGEAGQDASLRYPFDVVVDSAARQVTYCQVITPPYPVKPIPISAACR